MKIRVYLDQAISPGAKIEVKPETHHYLSRVLRLSPGDDLFVFHGDGHDYHACIAPDSSKKHTFLNIGDAFAVNSESPIVTHLFQAVSKPKHMDVAIQKAVECGVNHIHPIISDFCPFQLKQDAWQKRLQHWQSIIISACEQSGRAVLPSISVAKPFKQLEQPQLPDALHIVADPYTDLKLSELTLNKPDQAALWVGPEGGFSELELNLLDQFGVKRFNLGPRILRTETATITGLSLVQSLWGDL